MIKIDNVYDEIIEYNNILKSYNKVNRGRNRYSIESKIFQQDETNNLLNIQRKLIKLEIDPVKYREFTIKHPKERMIYAPDFESKIIQIAVNNVLMPELKRILIPDTYASIKGRGTHKAVDKIQHNMRCAKRRWGNKAYTLKLDIKKFFYSIDRDILKNIFRKYIEDERLLELLYKITDSANQIGEIGLPLGNTVSQLSANLYLGELDLYLKRRYSIEYYVRYMDDIILQVKSKEKAKEVLKGAEEFLDKNLKMKLNKNKSMYQKINKCVNSVGYKIWTTHKKLRENSKRTFRNILKEKDLTRFKIRIASWLGSAVKSKHIKFLLNSTSNLKTEKLNILNSTYFKITNKQLKLQT